LEKALPPLESHSQEQTIKKTSIETSANKHEQPANKTEPNRIVKQEEEVNDKKV
jgi:hypothetical protein